MTFVNFNTFYLLILQCYKQFIMLILFKYFKLIHQIWQRPFIIRFKRPLKKKIINCMYYVKLIALVKIQNKNPLFIKY